MTTLTRREFVQGAGVAGLGLLAGCGRLPGQAEPPTRVPHIGYLSAGTSGALDEAFRQGLGDFGYIDGQNLVIEYRWAEDRTEQLPDMAAELVQNHVDVILASAGVAVTAARRTGTTIPIVILASSDPVGNGMVASLARPGGNITGVSWMAPDLAAKRLDLLKTAVPNATRVGTLYNADTNSAGELRETQAAADTLGVQLLPMEVRLASDLEAAFTTATRGGAEAFIIFAHLFALSNRRRIIDLVGNAQRPAMYGVREFADDGGLLSYGPSMAALYHRAAYYVDRILKGTKPADLPVEQPMTFEFVINMKTAQALGLTIPPHVLLQATEVLQ